MSVSQLGRITMAEFGDLLSELRKDHKLTQEELANILFVSSGTISNYENNIHYPDVVKLKQLAEYFDVTTDYLLGRSSCNMSPAVLEQQAGNGKTWNQLIIDIQGLTPDRQKALLRVVNDMKTATLIEALKKERE